MLNELDYNVIETHHGFDARVMATWTCSFTRHCVVILDVSAGLGENVPPLRNSAGGRVASTTPAATGWAGEGFASRRKLLLLLLLAFTRGRGRGRPILLA